MAASYVGVSGYSVDGLGVPYFVVEEGCAWKAIVRCVGGGGWGGGGVGRRALRGRLTHNEVNEHSPTIGSREKRGFGRTACASFPSAGADPTAAGTSAAPPVGFPTTPINFVWNLGPRTAVRFPWSEKKRHVGSSVTSTAVVTPCHGPTDRS